MFELRWLVTPADPKTFTDEKRVLQYRRVEKIVRDVKGTGWFSRPQIVETAIWGEWQDVPMVANSTGIS
jgi:hypothetical protein